MNKHCDTKNCVVNLFSYISPIIEVMDIEFESAFCQSGTEGLDEKQGQWDLSN